MPLSPLDVKPESSSFDVAASQPEIDCGSNSTWVRHDPRHTWPRRVNCHFGPHWSPKTRSDYAYEQGSTVLAYSMPIESVSTKKTVEVVGANGKIVIRLSFSEGGSGTVIVRAERGSAKQKAAVLSYLASLPYRTMGDIAQGGKSWMFHKGISMATVKYIDTIVSKK